MGWKEDERDIRSRGGRIITAPGLQRGDPDGLTRDRDREDDTKPLWRHRGVQGTEKWFSLASFGTRDAVLMLALA